MKGSGAISWILVLAWAGPAAALTEYRVQVQTSVGSGTGVDIEQQVGGLNDTQVSNVQTNLSGTAVAEAFSSLSTTGYVPTLRVRSTNTGTRAQAVAWGVQGYTNETGAPFSSTLILDLTASITGPNDLDARIFMFQEESFSFSFDPGTMLFECDCTLWPGFDYTDFQLLYGTANPSIDETRTFDFTLQPGESFYIWAQLLATSNSAGVVDAFSTLTASFSDTSGLTPAATAVPEAGRLGLVALALVAAALGRRGPGGRR